MLREFVIERACKLEKNKAGLYLVPITPYRGWYTMFAKSLVPQDRIYCPTVKHYNSLFQSIKRHRPDFGLFAAKVSPGSSDFILEVYRK